MQPADIKRLREQAALEIALTTELAKTAHARAVLETGFHPGPLLLIDVMRAIAPDASVLPEHAFPAEES